jgi:8-oxo-dGTP pyrophosphatase MutT (NUDIX family)
MHENELWQVYNNNGSPINNKGATADDFTNDSSLIMSNAHVWLWRKTGDDIEILLQKRSATKATRPGWYHISAAGHINVNETAIEAALREAKEELNIDLDPSKLYFVHATRTIERNPSNISHVFLYHLAGNETFTYDDGEVELTEWRTLDNFKEITRDPEVHNLVPQGKQYVTALITALEYIA